jgi:formylglycine-generating enzyme required for sulfatase activity
MKIKIALIVFLLLPFVAVAADKPARNLAVNQANNAISEKRIALVIGNSAYINSPLKNPVNDAQDVAKKLRKLGFEVIERDNLTTKQIGRTLSEFRTKLVPGAVALVFYAGHGLQIKGENYLPAVDAEIAAEEDVPTQSIAVRHIMELLDEAKTRLNLVFLDACRNNPYARSFRSSAGDGLARISAPSGTLISYATRPGSVAEDGSGRNGLYTSKLLKQMDSNLQIELALKQVVTDVKVASQGKQEPWMEGSIEGDFCFAGCVAGGGTQVANLEPVLAPVGGNVSLDDIKKQQEARAQWDKWQQTMKTDFDKIVALNAAPDLQITAWERFLASYKEKNPFSEEDEQLRAQARSRKQAAEAKKQRQPITQAATVQTFRDCTDCPEMVKIPAGSFEMGFDEWADTNYLSEADKNYYSEKCCHTTKPVHTVIIGKAFAMATTEVTQGQWQSIMGNNPSHFSSCGEDCPVENVSWNDTQEFIQKLNAKTGKNYRLPSEAEWGYACLAGYTPTIHLNGPQLSCNHTMEALYRQTHHNDNDQNMKTHSVAGKEANSMGLYDMDGDVGEWTEDCWHDTYKGAPTDGSAWTNGDCTKRVARGGSWKAQMPQYLRNTLDASLRYNNVGFRLVRVLQ